MCFRPLLITTCFVFITALSFSVSAQNEIKEFSIKPALCIVEQEKLCHQRFIFYWRLTQPMQACLFKASEDEPLHCAYTKEVKLTKDIVLLESQEFELRSPQQAVKETIFVRQLRADVRQVRRHIWSVF
ncbi:DUF3019 domain-containing protein [Pseudoalteromonas sp. SSDWG2]|uniref:DUF3019 domain-containing protein n=1 Tax=Pseudoalteromonas sp. SSDWG2 TaxID=3139391 RepID=UPI003BA8B810